MRAAVEKLGLKLPVAILDEESLAPLWVNVVPSTIFVSANGTLVATASGKRSERFFQHQTQRLLSAGSQPATR